MKSPALQFYPGDWRRDTALQACSLRARGLWAEMLWIMHDGQPYGHLATPDGPIDVKTLARMVHAPLAVVTKDLEELRRFGVYSATEAGVIFSRRMVRDMALNSTRASYGHLGARYGVQGASYGALGGRPQKPPIKGGIQPPIEGGLETPVKPPPASAPASASAKRRTTPDPDRLSASQDGTGPKDGPEAMAELLARAKILRVAKGYDKS